MRNLLLLAAVLALAAASTDILLDPCCDGLGGLLALLDFRASWHNVLLDSLHDSEDSLAVVHARCTDYAILRVNVIRNEFLTGNVTAVVHLSILAVVTDKLDRLVVVSGPEEGY